MASHFNKRGYARMVDVGSKEPTDRVAVAAGRVVMNPATLERIQAGRVEKGDVLAVAQIAGISGAKRTSDLIPMCHPLMITAVDLEFKAGLISKEKAAIEIVATVKTSGQTGVEMEALTAVCVAALTLYDMCKAMDKEMTIGPVGLVSKSGGKSGPFKRAVPLSSVV